MYIMPMPPATILIISWLTMFLVGTELFVFSPLLPMLAADYGVSSMRAGWCVTAFSLTYMGSALLLGYVSDRVGRRRVLICSLLAFGAANLLTAAAPSLPWLIAARSFAGAAAGGVAPSIYALVSSAAPPNRRAAWLALPVSGLLVALALGASVGAAAGAAFGWASVFVALAAFSLVLAGFNCRVWPCERLRTDAAGPRPDLLAGAVLARRLMPTIMWGTSLYGAYTYLGTGLTAVAFSPAQVARAILCYGCAAIAGALIGGCLADRVGTKFTAGASLAGLCGCFLLLRLALSAGAFVEFTLGLSSAVAQLFFPAQQAGLAKDFPARSGTVLAWNNSALFLGIALGSLIGGSAAAIGGFHGTLAICAGIALFGCIINEIVVPGPTQSPRSSGLAAVRRVLTARYGTARQIPGRQQSEAEGLKPPLCSRSPSAHRSAERTGS
jgi:predicted MFS family arabinose efflux permease